MPESLARARDPYGAFRVPSFRAYWLFRLFGSTAVQIQSVAVGWQVYELTHSALALGLIGLAEAIPALGVALFAGHAADVLSRRAILWTTNLAFMVITALLAFVSMPHFGSLLHDNVWIIYVMIFLTGLCRGFFSPASFGLMGQIVPPELYGNASAWSSNVWQIACIIGPAAAGFLYGLHGPDVTYGVSSLLLLCGVFSLLAVKAPPTRAARPEQSVLASIREGLHFVFRNQVVLGAMSLDLFAVLFGGAVALLPIYADQILHTGSVGFGFLRAAPAIGSVIVGTYLSLRPVTRHAGRAMLWNVAAFGVCIILFAVSTNFYLSFLFLLLSGGFDAVSVFVRWTMLQIVTPDHMKGRVAAVSTIFVGSSNEIGEFESGVMARLLGVVPSAIFGGCMTLLVVAITAWLAPKLRHLDLSQVRHEP